MVDGIEWAVDGRQSTQICQIFMREMSVGLQYQDIYKHTGTAVGSYCILASQICQLFVAS